MKQTFAFILGLSLFAVCSMSAQTKMTAREAAVKIADRILASTTYDFKDSKTGKTYTNLKNVPLSMDMKVNSKYNNWHYTNGVTNIALMELGDKIGDDKYAKYVRHNMNFVFNEGNLEYFRRQYDRAMKEGGWNAVRKLSWHMIFRGKRLDDNGPMGASLIELQMEYPNEAFLKYINETNDHLLYAEPRLADGTIARIWPHENSIWADDAFMAISFLSRMGQFTGANRYFDDAANQVLSYSRYLWCPEKQIYYHCYHTDNKEHGVAHWSRANGWIFMAQADLLSRMPKNHPLRQAVMDNFKRQASGVARYQGKDGLWHQLLDKTDSYGEITGTAMFVFGIAKGVKEGWLHPDFIYVAEQGLKGMMTKISDNGDVTDICVGTGIMPSLSYYYNRPTQTNDPMGEGPVLRALVEMIDAPKYAEIKAEQQYDKIGMRHEGQPIDRHALVTRNNPHVTVMDSLSSLSVGNGEFAFTVDATGLQTFPKTYSNGVPLGTQSQWAWHSFANPDNLRPDEALKEYDFGHGHKELYATQFKEAGRAKDASEWYRVNPHRLHLGIIGFDMDKNVTPQMIKGIQQELDMWTGRVNSRFTCQGYDYTVSTVCHPEIDMVSAEVMDKAHTGICFRFPYPTGAHSDAACDWESNDKHSTTLLYNNGQSALLKRTVDATVYYVNIQWEGDAVLSEKGRNCFVLKPATDSLSFSCRFSEKNTSITNSTFAHTAKASSDYWERFWTDGAAVDFSACTDERAKELERRVVLSQYLLAIQCAGSTPPQETGLTYNSWFGKFHLEMIWWHQAQFALWNRENMLDRTLRWYANVEPMARQIAKRQGFDGVRWMKMTDPSGIEAPSKVGSFLIWQQPHIIYLAELIRRNRPGNNDIVEKYGDLVQKTAEFMYSFATKDTLNNRYVLKGVIPAQETLRADETVNPPFELSYWHYAMMVAQNWRELRGLQRNPHWDELINKLSSLAYNKKHLYLAAETAKDTYKDIRFTSDHMAVLGAVGILPMSKLVDKAYMKNTLHWILNNWNWDKTWGWDYPMTAMNAARMGEPEKAVGALLMDKRTNTYLVNGHNYQDSRLRVYLPGNGGLLTAVAMMCAGWDGCEEMNPGFPKDGKWNVRWEGLKPMP